MGLVRKVLLILVIIFNNLTQVSSQHKVNIGDSLALVDLYNSTNGPGWKNNSGWLEEPVEDWYGVEVIDGRITLLYLYSNNLAGKIPESVGQLTGLKYVSFYDNQLYGSIPTSIGKLTNLEQLWLEKNRITESIPTSVGSLTNLQFLSFEDNQLSGKIPESIGNLINLQYLTFENNRIGNELPPGLTRLINLQYLSIHENKISGTIPEDFGNLIKLQKLWLSNNKLSGTIPESIGELVNLSALGLERNNLTGKIPSAIVNLINLDTLSIFSNNLTGPIPPDIGKLTKLKELVLSENQLNGIIPASLGELIKLRGLRLSNNHLQGTIPSTFGNLTNLRYLLLDNNQLTGPIPSSLGNLVDLQSLWMNNNHFTFEGLEFIAEKFKFSEYAPQANIPIIQSDSLLSVSVGGNSSNNTYTWYRDNLLEVIIKGDSTYRPTFSGKYSVLVTNSIATKLTLLSNTVTIEKDNLVLSIYHQLTDINGKPRSTSELIGQINLNSCPSESSVEARISADGSRSTFFRLEGMNVDDYKLSLSQILPDDSETKGKLEEAVYKDGVLEVIYNHPSRFNGFFDSKEYITNLYLSKDNEIKCVIPLKIVRPPIIMVHGIFGDAMTFKKMEDQLVDHYKIYEKAQIYRIAYANDRAFDENAPFIFMGIESVIDQCKSAKISAGKADVICHSMGGLVTRAYLQGNVFPKYKNINRLITLNTPHAGSQITNLLLHPNLKKALRYATIYVMKGDPDAGAAESMKVNGRKVKALNNPNNISKNDVPTHVLTSTFDISSYNPLIEKYSPVASFLMPTITTAAIIYYKSSLSDLLGNPNSIKDFVDRILYQEENDVAVPLSSQKAGLGTPYMTFINNVMHAGSSDDERMIFEVVKLLNRNPHSEEFISGGKLAPPDLSGKLSDFLKADEKMLSPNLIPSEPLEFVSSSISIGNVKPGSIVLPGTTINLHIIGSNNIKVIQIICGNKTISTFNTYGRGPSNSFDYTIPINAAGRVNFIALGFNDNGFAAIDSLNYVIAAPQADLDSIVVYPESLLLFKGQRTILNVSGFYHDSIERDITSLLEVKYITKNNFLSVEGIGAVIGNKVGKDELTIEYLGKVITVPVTISDSLDFESPTKKKQLITFSELEDKTYDDPAFTLRAMANSGLPVSFSVVFGPAIITDSSLTLTGAGSVTVKASQAGDETYEAAPDIVRSFKVAKAQQAINFPDIPDKIVGDPPFQAQVSASSGLPVLLMVVSGPASISGDTVTLTGVEGIVTIVAKQPGNENYNPATDVIQSFVARTSAGCTGSGRISRDQFNITGDKMSSQLSLFEASNNGDFFAARIYGYLCPPQSGNYIFWVAGDNFTRLLLSSDQTPGNSKVIAFCLRDTNPRQWNKYASQKSTAVYLEAGRSYYIEAQHLELRGSDHVAVAWQLPDNTHEGPIPGSRLLHFVQDTSANQRLATSKEEMLEELNSLSNAEHIAKQGLIIYPNSFAEKANIEFSLQEGGNVILEIFKPTGELLMTLFEGKVEPHRIYFYELNGSEYANGAYILRYITQSKVLYKRIVVNK